MSQSPHSIEGKVVLIAGGAKNLGGLIATDLARHGASAVVVHYNSASSKADADRTVAAIEQAAIQASCETRLLVGQQAQAFTAAALPLCRTV